MSSPSAAAIPSHAALSVRTLAEMLLLALMWGLSIPVTKLGLETLPPLTLTALRFAVAAPLLLPFAFGRKRLRWRALPKVAALGVLGIGVGQVAQTFGVAGASASVGTVVSATIPLFMVLFAAMRLKQPVSGRQRLGLLAAFAGIAVIALGRGAGDAASGTSLLGAACLLLSSVAVAFYYVWGFEITRDYGAAPMAAWSTLFGFLSLLPWTAWEIGRIPFRLTLQGAACGVYLGLIVTVAGLFLWLNLLRKAPARIAASVQYLQPVVGVAAAAIVFDEKLGMTFALGIMLILAGLALAVAPKR